MYEPIKVGPQKALPNNAALRSDLIASQKE
jgi:hypothetical protein